MSTPQTTFSIWKALKMKSLIKFDLEFSFEVVLLASVVFLAALSQSLCSSYAATKVANLFCCELTLFLRKLYVTMVALTSSC